VIEANGIDAQNINPDSVRLSVGGIDPTPSALVFAPDRERSRYMTV